MLRLVIWMLLLTNAAYFAWTQGYLGALGWAPIEQAEPERLKAQIKPETLRLLNGPKGPERAAPAPVAPPAPAAEAPAPPPAAASEPAPDVAPSGATPSVATASTPTEPPAPPTACWQASGYTSAQGESLRTALTRLDLPRGSWQLNDIQTGGRWVVYMGSFNEEQMARKKTELREMGVAFRSLSVPALGPGLALGTFSSEASAQQALQDATRKGVRTARVALERPETTSVRLRLPAATEAQHASVAGLGTVLAGKSLQRCD